MSQKIIDVNGQERQAQSIHPDEKFPGYLKVIYLSRRDGTHLPPVWYPVDTFKKNNPNLNKIINNSTPEPTEVVGRVTSSGPDFIRDNTKNWPEDQYVNFPVWISRGKGEGQMRKVITNTKNTLTVGENWKTKPDDTSQYVLSYNIHEAKPLGNTIPGLEFETNADDQN